MNLVSRLAASAVAAALAFAAAPASAQWMWKDEGGHTIASDQPPPPNTPASRILKSPRKTPVATAPNPDASSGDAKPADPAKQDAPKTLADRELDAKKQERERAEAQKKSDDEAAKVAALKENCSAVRGNLAGLQAGGRASRVNEKGEKTYLDDSQRAAEIAKAQGQIAQYCK